MKTFVHLQSVIVVFSLLGIAQSSHAAEITELNERTELAERLKKSIAETSVHCSRESRSTHFAATTRNESLRDQWEYKVLGVNRLATPHVGRLGSGQHFGNTSFAKASISSSQDLDTIAIEWNGARQTQFGPPGWPLSEFQQSGQEIYVLRKSDSQLVGAHISYSSSRYVQSQDPHEIRNHIDTKCGTEALR